jgi:hypothetical protein
MAYPDWQDIASAPTDWTVFMVAWPHPKMDGGYMFDFWSGKHLTEMREAIANGAQKRAPHLYWLPTHWASLPRPPHIRA